MEVCTTSRQTGSMKCSVKGLPYDTDFYTADNLICNLQVLMEPAAANLLGVRSTRRQDINHGPDEKSPVPGPAGAPR